jgi:glyoxalase family protein
VTATVADAVADLGFCRSTLGLRLLKKTVNFDNHNVYHFYYGDERGTPGTIWTTFPYQGWGVAVGRKGEGQITATSFSVPSGSLAYWRERLRVGGVKPRDSASPFGEPSLEVADPSGLVFHLVADDRDERTPWTGTGIGAEAAIRGLHGVTMVVGRPEPTIELLTEMLGFEVVNEAPGRLRLAVGGREPGKLVDVLHGTGAPPAANGLGTVHHVALAIGSGEEQRGLREELLAGGYKVTEVLDRQYFQSIYFREPGGILLEVATVGPGFTIDESLADLGQALRLPPWEENNRALIAAQLPPLDTRGQDHPVQS